MIWLLTRLVVVPMKTMTRGFKVGFWTGRFVGWRRLLLVGLGLGAGVLVAPGPGADLRALLRERLERISGRSKGGTKVVVAKPPPVTDTVVSPQPGEAEPAPSEATRASEPLPAAPDADPATAGTAPDEPTPVDATVVDPTVVDSALVDPVDPTTR